MYRQSFPADARRDTTYLSNPRKCSRRTASCASLGGTLPSSGIRRLGNTSWSNNRNDRFYSAGEIEKGAVLGELGQTYHKRCLVWQTGFLHGVSPDWNFVSVLVSSVYATFTHRQRRPKQIRKDRININKLRRQLIGRMSSLNYFNFGNRNIALLPGSRLKEFCFLSKTDVYVSRDTDGL